MANVETADKAERGKADHFFLLADGVASVVDGKETRKVDITEAIGYRYTDRATGRSFDFYPVLPKGMKAGSPLLMLALFGAKTQATNTASAARQARAEGRDDAPADDIAALQERFGPEGLADGVWLPESQREGGPRYNSALLAEAIAAAKGSTDVAAFAARIAAEPEYGPKAWQVKEVKAHYRRLAADRALAEVDKPSDGLADL